MDNHCLDVYADWLRRRGYNVVRTKTCYWFNAGTRIQQAFFNQIIQPTDEEIKKLLFDSKSLALRYSLPVGGVSGKLSYHVVYQGPKFEISSFSKKVRHDISHGLEYATYEPISFARLANEGWEVRVETLTRQGRIEAEHKDWWHRLCMSAEGLPGFEAWGAMHDGKLCASILGFYDSVDRCYSVLYQQSRTQDLKFGVNNTLAYAVSNHALSLAPDVSIFYGVHSLDAPASVDEFKFRMGFIAKPVRQRVVFTPLIPSFCTDLAYKGLKIANQALPSNATFAKAKGMLYFYLQGKLPLIEQDWPETLLPQKENILAQASLCLPLK